jgi:hypothetical protein
VPAVAVEIGEDPGQNVLLLSQSGDRVVHGAECR